MFPRELIIMAGMFGIFLPQTSLAACPNLNSYLDIDIKNVNELRNRFGRTIYFCKQNFASNALTLVVNDTDLVTNGNQAIAAGQTQQVSNIGTSSVNFTGMIPSDMNINTINGDFPNTNGAFASPSLFNFYTRIRLRGRNSCDRAHGRNQFNYIKNYLRANANIFQASSSGLQTAVQDSTGNHIARINGAQLVHQTTGDTIPATIVFYHANQRAGQYFTRGSFWSPQRYCWVGVGARLEIDSSNSNVNIKNAGDYVVRLGVLTEE